MALTETELQDILGALSPEEQRQLFERLGQTFKNDKGTSEESPIKDVQPRITNTGKVYCCPLCGSANYKKHRFTYNNMQRYICKDCGRTFSENYGDSLRYSHLSEETWREILRGFIEELSLTKIAQNVGCSTKTAWLAKVKVNQAL